MPTEVLLLADDGVLVPAAIELISTSPFLMDLLDNFRTSSNFGEFEREVIPLPQVKSKVLQKIILWAEHHKGDAPPVEEAGTEAERRRGQRSDDVDTWDQAFMDELGPTELCEVLHAVFILELPLLFQLGCKGVANLIKKAGNPEAIRQMFGITNDLTPEQEEQIRRENDMLDEVGVFGD